jgi:hypothetical protein
MSVSRPERSAVRNSERNAALVESTRESIREVLGEKAAQVLFHRLENNLDITLDETPHRLKDFFSALQDIFGDRGTTIAKAVLRGIYTRLALRYVENPDSTFLEYIADAVAELDRSQDDFATEWVVRRQLPDLMATNRNVRATNMAYVI